MKTLALVLLFSLPLCSCGSGAKSSQTSPVSVWAGNYTGTINFKGCPTNSPCGGDTITLTIADSANSSQPGEFLATVTGYGEDSTVSQSFSANGTVLYTGAAGDGPGTTETTGALYLSHGLSYNFFMTGTGSSSTSSPVLIDSIALNALLVNGITDSKGPIYYGTLTRVQ